MLNEALLRVEGIGVKKDFAVNCRKDIKIHIDSTLPKYISFAAAVDENVTDDVNNSIVNKPTLIVIMLLYLAIIKSYHQRLMLLY